MIPWLEAVPGRIYVVATLLPLGAFVLLLVGGGVRAACRPFRRDGGLAGSIYWICGGNRPLKTGAFLATACMGAAAILGVAGLVWFATDSHEGQLKAARWAERTDWVRIGSFDSSTPPEWDRQRGTDHSRQPPPLALALELGYKIDHLSAVLFAMVTITATLIFTFSLGYMKDEAEEFVVDHQVHIAGGAQTHGHADSHGEAHTGEADAAHHDFHRRGRFGQFFLYLSLFAFSMLDLLIADNLFQVFVSWELVGVCSFFLIGFYYERRSAALAANKAFIVNRIGDAGFLIGILIAWTYLGTLNFEEMFHRVRAPDRDSHGKVELGNQLVRVNATSDASQNGARRYVLPPRGQADTGADLLLFPLREPDPSHFHGPGHDSESTFTVPERATYTTHGVIPYWLFVVMGIGIFLGCVGKSAQFPLHTWLPDAMEGPTPVSALIHAATMVAAGVYLVGRAYPLFAAEVLLVIAYTGAVTLFMAATIALVQTDIKRVLAYSTCSQLGYMMLALGVGGWVAGLLHLVTHAFFKALLFLCSGSVIHGCHHEQDIRKMGGLRRKMPITAFTMLVGVLAISGAPLLSGWYSKDQIIAATMGFGLERKPHILLLLLPLIASGFTAFYMFRLWFLTFAGKPRDERVEAHAHESPAVMTIPLIILAAFSIGVAWGWPAWEADASYLGHLIGKSEPGSVGATFVAERETAHHEHMLAATLAFVLALLGASLAYWLYGRRQPAAEALYARGGPGYRFLLHKWYFDEVYASLFVKPTVELARASAALDKRPTDGPANGGTEPPPRRFDLLTLDGAINTLGQLAEVLGQTLRRLQTGHLRTYVFALALTAALLLGILTALAAGQ
jgi:NADH-quinone oxidoreductase subunit L